MPLATLTKNDACAGKDTIFNKADLAVAHNAHSVTSTATQAELAVYHHQSLFCPTETTLLKAVNNNQCDSFPGLTKSLLKHLPPSTATHKGHMHRTRQGIQSSQKNPNDTKAARAELEDLNPPQEMCATEEAKLFCFAALADTHEGVIYTDLPGPFPVESFQMKSRSAACMVEAYRSIYEYLTDRGFKPKVKVMDNECSKAVKAYILSQNVALQLAESDNHRANAAERAIQTFKNHFIAGLATVDPAFPL